ncbi:MAG: hypothetical protein EOM00_15765 [Clostridia bacterium]|nr:hypothetical protein [Clostridia bacterium]
MRYYSRTKAREYAQEMERIESFCTENGINASRSLDSFYFSINGVKFRVSNHTIEASDRGMRDSLTGEKLRDSYHNHEDDFVCITAGKTRIAEIYTALKNGKELTKRGYVK